MRARVCSALAAALVSCSFASGQAAGEQTIAELPLLVAFKTFCMDTHSAPDAIKTAVEAAGGISPHPPGATDWPFHMTAQGWNLVFEGHRMFVGTGTMHTAANGQTPAMDSQNCIIFGGQDDEAGLAAIADWIGVPVSSRNGDELTYYTFVERDGKRVSIAAHDAQDWRKIDTGGYWTLVLIHFPKSASLQLTYSQTSLDPR